MASRQLRRRFKKASNASSRLPFFRILGPFLYMEMTILIRFNAVMAMRRVSDQAFCKGTRFRSGMQGLLIAHCDVVMSELVLDSLDSFVES
jgi:hypothetical protein